MFPNKYFGKRYFADRYFGPLEAVSLQIGPPASIVDRVMPQTWVTAQPLQPVSVKESLRVWAPITVSTSVSQEEASADVATEVRYYPIAEVVAQETILD